MPRNPIVKSTAAGIFLLSAACCCGGCRTTDNPSAGTGPPCTPLARPAMQTASVEPLPSVASGEFANAPDKFAIRTVAATGTLPESSPIPTDPQTSMGGGRCDDPFANQPQLDPEALVAAVRYRNPSLAAMAAAWRAAAEKYPQAVSLDDPQLSTAMGPGTFGDPTHDVAWMVQGSQKIPWPGKRGLRGQEAQAEASAARLDLDDAEVRLVATARLAFWEYYLVRRQQELNAENRDALRGFRDTAQAKYRAALATQQDVLESDVELAEIERRQFELDRRAIEAVARINTLLHRPPDQPLPPPRRPDAAAAVPDIGWLQQFAAQHRPDLAAIGEQLRAAQAAIDLAQRDYYPDLDLVARYDAFWQKQDRPLAPMVGLDMNVPLDNARRQAAVREASDRLDQRRWEYEARLDEVHRDVQTSYAELQESDKVLAVYRQSILPAAGQYLNAARSNYAANTLDFLHLIDAQRRLIQLREQYEQALAEREERWAELQRATGGAWPAPANPELIPPPPTARR